MLKITEILPNPKGTDTNNEFIEITNFSNESINLKGFSLDDGEKGSKPYKFTTDTIILPSSSKSFYNSITKIALNNTSDSARLFDQSGTLIDELKYEKTSENKSYSYTEILSEKGSRILLLETDPTPNKQNKKLYKLTGTITEKTENSFQISEEKSRKTLTINYSQTTKELSDIAFAKNTELSILASKESASIFKMIDYQILKPSSQNESTSINNFTEQKEFKVDLPVQIIILPITIILIIILLIIKRKHLNHSCQHNQQNV
ncbi:MAG TPA: lamin tail domain-containing protein [Candidatus Gracilibacteria bacterium]|nr:lamin tail domain-containing protein [Candidatus Gracilibacteria bacterium]